MRLGDILAALLETGIIVSAIFVLICGGLALLKLSGLM